MSLVYDDVAENCSSNERYIFLAEIKEASERFRWIVLCVFKGKLCICLDSSFSKDKLCWRLFNEKCNMKRSIREGKWFNNSNLLLERIINVPYYWVYKCPADFVSRELGIGRKYTLVELYNFAREVCVKIFQRDSEQKEGEGKEVAFDRSRFGKRKYHRGKRVKVLKDKVRSDFF